MISATRRIKQNVHWKVGTTEMIVEMNAGREIILILILIKYGFHENGNRSRDHSKGQTVFSLT